MSEIMLYLNHILFALGLESSSLTAEAVVTTCCLFILFYTAGVRKKLGGGVFAENPHATWAEGWRGTEPSSHHDHHHDHHDGHDQHQDHDHDGSHHHHHYQQQQQRLDKKLLQQLNKQQQQQQQRGDHNHDRITPEEGGSDWLVDSAAAAAAGGQSQTLRAGCGEQRYELCCPKLTTAANTAAAVGSSDVELVLPLHASAFGYRPTKSAFRRKRVMMQQVGCPGGIVTK